MVWLVSNNIEVPVYKLRKETSKISDAERETIRKHNEIGTRLFTATDNKLDPVRGAQLADDNYRKLDGEPIKNPAFVNAVLHYCDPGTLHHTVVPWEDRDDGEVGLLNVSRTTKVAPAFQDDIRVSHLELGTVAVKIMSLLKDGLQYSERFNKRMRANDGINKVATALADRYASVGEGIWGELEVRHPVLASLQYAYRCRLTIC